MAIDDRDRLADRGWHVPVGVGSHLDLVAEFVHNHNSTPDDYVGRLRTVLPVIAVGLVGGVLGWAISEVSEASGKSTSRMTRFVEQGWKPSGFRMTPRLAPGATIRG